LTYHCEKNYDAKALLNRVNAVWTPQANIVFALASSDPALLDDQAAIAKAVGSTSPKATVPPIIEFDDFSEMFQKLRDKEKPQEPLGTDGEIQTHFIPIHFKPATME
jgi:hypothetical protein